MMEIVPVGLPLGFEVTFDSNSLEVAMRVFDDLGVQVGSPIQMINVFGNTYRGFFTPDDVKGFLIQKAVYTDNTYTTLDPNYSQGSETIIAIRIGGASSGGCSVVGYVLNNDEVVGLVDGSGDVKGIINC